MAPELGGGSVMTIRPVKTDNDYRKAMLRIDELMGAIPDTAAGEELDVLTTLVEVYEREHFTIGSPDSKITQGTQYSP